jgi:hypothetical protein
MEQSISDIVFTPSVKAIQERMGSRQQYERKIPRVKKLNGKEKKYIVAFWGCL